MLSIDPGAFRQHGDVQALLPQQQGQLDGPERRAAPPSLVCAGGIQSKGPEHHGRARQAAVPAQGYAGESSAVPSSRSPDTPTTTISSLQLSPFCALLDARDVQGEPVRPLGARSGHGMVQTPYMTVAGLVAKASALAWLRRIYHENVAVSLQCSRSDWSCGVINDDGRRWALFRGSLSGRLDSAIAGPSKTQSARHADPD